MNSEHVRNGFDLHILLCYFIDCSAGVSQHDKDLTHREVDLEILTSSLCLEKWLVICKVDSAGCSGCSSRGIWGLGQQVLGHSSRGILRWGEQVLGYSSGESGDAQGYCKYRRIWEVSRCIQERDFESEIKTWVTGVWTISNPSVQNADI